MILGATTTTTTNPIRRNHIADAVFQGIAEKIFAGELIAGDRLPAEKQWAEYFSVSRLVVRQAVHRLAELGMVQVRQGGATLVMDPAECDHPSVGVLALQFSPEKEDQINAFRERQVVGSMGMMVLVQRRITKTDVADLRAIVQDYVAAPTDMDKLNEQFWERIAQITMNPFLLRETRFWFRVIRENRFLQDRDHIPDTRRIEAYHLLLNELEAGRDPTEAYRSIVEAVIEILEKGKA
jgi:GntR family transcriptional regulator, transcriptional repressor for pyruvate dehydrogenase complex